MDYIIRHMEVADIPAVLELWKGIKGIKGIGRDDDCDTVPGITRYLERNPGMSFVAYEADQMVGAVLCGHDGRRGYLHHLAVSDDFRGKGIGKALAAKCLDELKEQGIPKCNIFVYHDNQLGRRFWLETGWNQRDDLALLQKMTQ